MKKNFLKRIFINTSIVIIILVNIFLMFFSKYIYTEISDTTITNLNQLTYKTSREISSLFQDMDKISLYLSTNPEVMSAFKYSRTNKITNNELSSSIGNTITSISVPNDSSRFRINLFNDKANFISTGIPYNGTITEKKLSSSEYLQWYETLPIKHTSSYITSFNKDTWSDNDLSCISLYREIFDPNVFGLTNGIIEVQSPYKLIDVILNLDSIQTYSYLFNESGDIIYPTSYSNQISDLLFTNHKDLVLENDFNFLSNNIIYSGIRLENDWILVLSQPQKKIISLFSKVTILYLSISIILLLIFLYILFKVLEYTTKPLTQLTDSITTITMQSPYLNFDSNNYSDEFTNLTSAFDKMMERLTTSMDNNIKMKKYEMNANVIALQSQMNPHFLYNMLTIIKAMSRQNESLKIGNTCDYLVKMLRYSSTYDEDYVPIQKEIKHTEDYLALMRIRYEEMFNYTITIAPSFNSHCIEVPKLSLQPIVENCFQHGFKKILPPWKINISCWLSDNRWYISIEDNGSGITENEIIELFKKIDIFLENPSTNLSSLKIGGMGLINTISRLKLKYNDDITIDIKSIPTGGTKITIGGLYYDKNITC